MEVFDAGDNLDHFDESIHSVIQNEVRRRKGLPPLPGPSENNLPTPPNQETKTCPACATIQESWAHVCPKCGFEWPDLSPGESGTDARLKIFNAELSATTPKIWLTPGLIGINAAVFIAMIATGVNFLTPSTQSLLLWGANYSALVTSGQWWRLFSCMFLHVGIIHIAFNMFVLWNIGKFMERLLGSYGFLVVYLISGLCGSVASIWWKPFQVSAGASGAIFGLYGALVGFMLRGTHTIPKDVSGKLIKNALVFVGYNIFFGITNPGIDMAAHIGGLSGGFLCGLALAQPLTNDGMANRKSLNLRVLAGGIIFISITAIARPRTQDLQGRLFSFFKLESQAVDTFNSAVKKAQSGSLGDNEFANIMDTQVLPPIKQAQISLESLNGLPSQQAEFVSKLDTYVKSREQAWALFSEALHEHDLNKAKRAQEMQIESERLLKNIK